MLPSAYSYQPASQSVNQDASQLANQPASQSGRQPARQLVSQPASQPDTQPASQSDAQAASQLASQLLPSQRRAVPSVGVAGSAKQGIPHFGCGMPCFPKNAKQSAPHLGCGAPCFPLAGWLRIHKPTKTNREADKYTATHKQIQTNKQTDRQNDRRTWSLLSVCLVR